MSTKLADKLDNFNKAWQELNYEWDVSDVDVNGLLDYPFNKCFNELQHEVSNWVEEFTSFLNSSKRNEIEAELDKLFNLLGMNTPNNYGDIVQYCYEDVCESAEGDNWSDEDVRRAFRRWLEGENRED